MTRALLAVWIVLIAGCDAGSSEAVNLDSPVARQEDEVRRFIDFDRLAASIDAKRGVAVVWPDLRQFFPEQERDWELVRDQVEFAAVPGLVERLYIFRKGDAQLTIDLFVSSRGPQPALKQLVDTMVATSIGYRRYEQGPADIGQLCRVLPLPNPTVLVIDHNVLLRIRRTQGTFDIVSLARQLTKFIDANVVPSLAEKAPAFAEVSVTPASPAVGASVKIAVRLPAAFPPKELVWAVSSEVDSDIVDQSEQGSDYAELRITRPGRIEVPLWIADRRTLLSSESRVGIDVRP